jgi:hypothetical protein
MCKECGCEAETGGDGGQPPQEPAPSPESPGEPDA